jgi:hypothetical protein
MSNIVCNDRWDEAWPQIAATLRQQAQQRSVARRRQRRTARTATTPLATSVPGMASPPPPLWLTPQ